MAGARTLNVFFLVASAAATMTHASESIMRRQMRSSSPQIYLGPSGELHATLRMNQHDQKQRQPGEVSYCDTSYPLGNKDPTTVSVCQTGDHVITREEDCKHAAKVLSYTIGDEFNLKDDYIDATTNKSDGERYAKNCVLIDDGTTKKVYMNPTESGPRDANGALQPPTGGWEGTPICTRAIYKNGTSGEHADAGCSDSEYEAVNNYAECEWAHDCQFGGMFCQEPDFGNDQYATKEAPKGCYRNDATGCYGFNANTNATDDTWTLTGKSVVCKLKTYNYTGDKADDKVSKHNAATTAAPASTF